MVIVGYREKSRGDVEGDGGGHRWPAHQEKPTGNSRDTTDCLLGVSEIGADF